MGINDPYDRTGQYAGGDTGPKVGGFAHGQQPDGSYVGDRRDHAIGTMVGDGWKDNREGYGAILDAIENRIGAIDRFNGRGVNGHYGVTRTGDLLNRDSTLDSVVTARTGAGGYQFSNWSPRNEDAYALTQNAYRGTPQTPAEQDYYDQAMDVYDTYYDDTPLSMRGVAQGGTYYQNREALSPRQARGQLSMQAKYGGLPVGELGHVVTGPGLTAFGKAAYDPIAEQINGYSYDDLGLGPMQDDLSPSYDQISGYAYQDDPLSYSYTDDLGNYHEFAGYVDDPMEAQAYGPATAEFGYDPMAPDAYGPAEFDFADDPMEAQAYGPAYGAEYEDAMAPGQYGPATADFRPDDDAFGTGYAMPSDQISGLEDGGFVGQGWGDDLGDYAEYDGVADPMAPESYGTGYATPTETVKGIDAQDAFGFGSYDDALKDGYAEYTGTEDPMNPDAYGQTPGPAISGTEETDFSTTGWADSMPTSTSAIPSPTPAPARTATTTPPATPASFTPPQARTQTSAPAFSQPAARSVQQQPSAPFGRVGGTGDPAATTMRADRTIADNQGAYGGKDAFGPNDAFGGLGFGRSEYGGYADVVDSFNRATGDITRTVTDRFGNVLDQKTANTGGGGWDGRATGENSRGDAQRGDGSYSESSGRNDNNPQGIL